MQNLFLMLYNANHFFETAKINPREYAHLAEAAKINTFTVINAILSS